PSSDFYWSTSMTEDDFDALMQSRSFGTQDAINAETQILHGMTLLSTLGVALWGKTEDDLRRQLLKPHPEIPPGFDLADFRELLHICAQMAAAIAGIQKVTGQAHVAPWSNSIHVGSESFTILEARCEVIRRAIDYTENR